MVSCSLIAGCLLGLLVGSSALAANPEPSAVIEVFRVREGVRVPERATGVITFQGETFPIRIRGLTPNESQKATTLKVYNLAALNDLAGEFQQSGSVTSSTQAPQCCVLRNERGVEIRYPEEQNPGGFTINENGVTVEIASRPIESGGSFIHGRLPRLLPQSAGFGSRHLGPVLFTPTLNIQTVGFAEANNAWGGRTPASKSRFFYEQSNEEGLNASLNLDDYGIIVGRVSGIFSTTGGGLDAEATNDGNLHPYDYALESGYLEWDSGPLFPELGYDAISISGGPQNYTIADGFLFTRGASNGGSRGAAWLNPRTAFGLTGIISLRTHDVLLQGFYLEPNYNPPVHTKLAGVNFETPLGEDLTIGFTYCNIFQSSISSEKGLNLFYARANATPIPAFEDFHLLSAFAAESNGQRISGANGWYVSPYYEFSQFAWRPTLFYRYASFTGGGTNGNRDFDPLYYGSSDWGSWYQGEIVGNWVAINSNLISHQVRVEFSPTRSTTVDLMVYKFLLYSRAQTIVEKSVAPVTSKNLAEEADLALQYAPAPWWLISMTISTAIPNRAASEIMGGSQTWVQSMLMTSVTF
jgi:hypothetical protein